MANATKFLFCFGAYNIKKDLIFSRLVLLRCSISLTMMKCEDTSCRVLLFLSFFFHWASKFHMSKSMTFDVKVYSVGTRLLVSYCAPLEPAVILKSDENKKINKSTSQAYHTFLLALANA